MRRLAARLRARITFANAVSSLALFIALGGTSYAAIKLPKGSVSTVQVKNRSLLAKDFKAGQLKRGPNGATGATGSQGAQGTAGPQGPKGDAGQAGGLPRYASARVGNIDLTDSNQKHSQSLPLPAGRWNIQATAYSIRGTGEAGCQLEADGELLNGSTVDLFPGSGGTFGNGGVILQGDGSFTGPTDVYVSCGPIQTGTNMSVLSITLSATQVAS